jgi:ribosomal L13e-like protein
MKTQVQEPTIKRWNRGMQIVRAGRGYSKAELGEVGLRDVRRARNHGIPVDPLRTTSYPENVDRLRGVAKTIIDSKIDAREPKTERRDSKKKTEVKRKTPTTKSKRSTRKKTSE